jgi:anti-sigma factor RsiW
MCNDKTIKELLPAYLEEALDRAEKLKVVSHLASCDDCRIELSLLHMMAEETVPDPGDAFWAALPDRVSQAVRKHQPKKKTFDLAWLVDLMALPRWTWTAATVGTVLIISWFLVMPLHNKMEIPQSQGDEFADEAASTWSVSVADLDRGELSTIDTWAGSELAAIAQEAEPLLGNGRDSDIYETLEDLNAREIEQFSKMLGQIRQEG